MKLVTEFRSVGADNGVDVSRALVLECTQELGLSGGLRHRCPNCGGVSHGRPLVYLASVSLSRAPGMVAAVASTGRPLGIDLEQAGRVPTEMARKIRHPDDAISDLTELWVAKEAAVKAWGVGLRADFREVQVGQDSVTWRGFCCALTWLAAPDGYVAALAQQLPHGVAGHA